MDTPVGTRAPEQSTSKPSTPESATPKASTPASVPAPAPAQAPAPAHPAAPDEWWRSAVIYQVYPRSFADSNGDGMGDLPGITAHLDYLRDLGVDAVWVSPFYPSPQADAGYDVADYRGVDPLFGTLTDADALIAAAHSRGLRIIVDLVPNHTSDRHPWFTRALAAAPGSPERDWYMFRDVDPDHPEQPPNNWESIFGGSAWSLTPESATGPAQWYLHLFDSSQPDLNWENPAVRAAFADILRFWLDRGVDGFRVDVAHGMIKAPGLPDTQRDLAELQGEGMAGAAAPFWDQDGVHEIYLEWRKLLDSYDGQRVMVAEAWVQPFERIARYVRPGEHHQAFNFAFIDTQWDAAALRDVIAESYRVSRSVGAPTTWVLSNHDVIRHASRLALAPEHLVTQLAGPVPEPDRALGLARARAATTMMLALPGSAYIYQGEELGLPEVLDLAPEHRADPSFHRTAGQTLGRDGCRVPLPWRSDAPGFGFGPDPWLPQPDWFADYAVDRQEGSPESTLELYRRLLAARRARGLGAGELDLAPVGTHPDAVPAAPGTDPAAPDGAVPAVPAATDGTHPDAAPAASGTDPATASPAEPVRAQGEGAANPGSGLVVFDVRAHGATTRIVLNLGTADWPVPAGAHVVLASRPGIADAVPPETAAWIDLG